MEGAGTAAVTLQPFAQIKLFLEGRDSPTLTCMTKRNTNTLHSCSGLRVYCHSDSLSEAKLPSRYSDMSCVMRRKATKGRFHRKGVILNGA